MTTARTKAGDGGPTFESSMAQMDAWPRTLALNPSEGDVLADGILSVRSHVRLQPGIADAALVGVDMYRAGRLELVGARDSSDGDRRKVTVVGDLEHGLGRSVTMRPARFAARTPRGSGVEAVNMLQPLLDVQFPARLSGCGALFDVRAFVTGNDASVAQWWTFAVSAGPAGYRVAPVWRKALQYPDDEWEVLVSNPSWNSMRLALRWRKAAQWSNRAPSVAVVARVVSAAGDDNACVVRGLDSESPSVDGTAYPALQP